MPALPPKLTLTKSRPCSVSSALAECGSTMLGSWMMCSTGACIDTRCIFAMKMHLKALNWRDLQQHCPQLDTFYCM